MTRYSYHFFPWRLNCRILAWIQHQITNTVSLVLAELEKEYMRKKRLSCKGPSQAHFDITQNAEARLGLVFRKPDLGLKGLT